MCCVYCAVLPWGLYPLGQLSTEVLFACCGQCLVPSLNVAYFNYVYSDLFVK